MSEVKVYFRGSGEARIAVDDKKEAKAFMDLVIKEGGFFYYPNEYSVCWASSKSVERMEYLG